MRTWLSSCARAVVTAGAICGRVSVIEAGRNPSGGPVAVLASIVGRQVRARLTLGGRAVVTAGTVSGHPGMIEPRSAPAIGIVAGRAILARSQVTAALAGCPGAVVAAGTVARDPAVVEADGIPAGRAVAGAAFLGSWQMAGGLADGLNAVVASGAAAAVPAVIKPFDLPLLCAVAAVAIVLGAQVVWRHPGGADRIVAALAIARRPGKFAVLVAAFAAHSSVGASQGEAGAEVIEPGRLVLGGSRHRAHHQEERGQQCHQCCMDPSRQRPPPKLRHDPTDPMPEAVRGNLLGGSLNISRMERVYGRSRTAALRNRLADKRRRLQG